MNLVSNTFDAQHSRGLESGAASAVSSRASSFLRFLEHHLIHCLLAQIDALCPHTPSNFSPSLVGPVQDCTLKTLGTHVLPYQDFEKVSSKIQALIKHAHAVATNEEDRLEEEQIGTSQYHGTLLARRRGINLLTVHAAALSRPVPTQTPTLYPHRTLAWPQKPHTPPTLPFSIPLPASHAIQPVSLLTMTTNNSMFALECGIFGSESDLLSYSDFKHLLATEATHGSPITHITPLPSTNVDADAPHKLDKDNHSMKNDGPLALVMPPYNDEPLMPTELRQARMHQNVIQILNSQFMVTLPIVPPIAAHLEASTVTKASFVPLYQYCHPNHTHNVSMTLSTLAFMVLSILSHALFR
jgi:hypothetical protein